MFKNLLFILLVITLVPFKAKAEWVPLDKNSKSNTSPKVTLISDGINNTVIKIEISGFDVKEFMSQGKTYQGIDLLSEIFSTEPGSPEIPYIAKVLAIPDQAAVSVEVLETSEVLTFANVYLPPARLSWIEGQPESPYEENNDIYQSNDVYPNVYAEVEAPSVFRDFRIARVSVFPVRYVPATNELKVVSSITVRINYGAGEVVNPKTTAKKAIAPSFGKLYRSLIFNYQNVLDKFYGGKEEGYELMLCIMPDEFVASFQIYADWKRESGTDIHVTKFSDISANATNPDIIKNHISDAYHNWEIPPTYVLLVGDDGIFPKKIVTYPDYSFPNEDYFVEVEGNDYFPEMMIGRFTNEGDYRMQVMIHKFLLYEKTPYTANTAWFKKATVCSNNEYQSQIDTKRFTANVMLQNGGFTSVDTMMSDGWGGNCTYDLNDILNAINEGRSYLNYRGEGWYYGWYASCYDFAPSDVSSLTNGEKFTFVTSIGCGVAMFDAPGGNCFGETWVELGSLTSARGGVAFVGPTSNTHTTQNNKIDKGIYVGMFQEGLDTPGQALLRGKMYMYNVFGNDPYTSYHFKVYCVLGDPSIHIWRDVPQTVNVSYPSSIQVGNNLLEITVSFASSGGAVENAEVCLTGEDVFITGVTNSEGKAYIELMPEIPETLTITVRGGNVYPFQGTITVTQPAQLVEPFGDPVIVDLDGNMDGLVNPNENCNITFTLKNWGNQTASNVQATLTAINSNFIQIITTNAVNFGNLSAGNSFTGNPFQFFVKPACLVGQMTQLQLHVTSNNGTWDYLVNLDVTGCKLEVDNFMINDQGSPFSNFRLDPGETVKLYISVLNYGDDIAPNVFGVLTSNDPNITIQDPSSYFGTLQINNTAINSDDYFMVTASSSCPTGYMAECSIELFTQDGNYPYHATPAFYLPVSLPIPADYTGPDAYGYYAYSSNDAFYDQTPDYEWAEIEGLGTQIVVPPLISDFTQTVSLPFTFKYYGIDYTQIRISTDGWIAFGSGNQVSHTNTVLPNFDVVNNMVAPFWDDLYDTEIIEGDIFHYFDSGNNRFIIEWDTIAHNDSLTEPKKEIFQLILLDPDYYPTVTGDGEIIFQYKKVEAPESVTIGIENNLQTVGLQYVFNNDYAPTASELINEIAIKFTTEPPSTSIITSVDEYQDAGKMTGGYGLEQNNPNPFQSQTRINYLLPKETNVTLTIFNARGEQICTLQNGPQSAGKHSVDWNGSNDEGNQVVSGLYFYRLQAEGYSGTRKMFMLK